MDAARNLPLNKITKGFFINAAIFKWRDETVIEPLIIMRFLIGLRLALIFGLKLCQ